MRSCEIANIKQTIAKEIRYINEKGCERIRVEKKNREVSNNQRF